MILLTLKGSQSDCCVKIKCMVRVRENKRGKPIRSKCNPQGDKGGLDQVVVAELVKSGWILEISGMKDNRISSQNS